MKNCNFWAKLRRTSESSSILQLFRNSCKNAYSSNSCRDRKLSGGVDEQKRFSRSTKLGDFPVDRSPGHLNKLIGTESEGEPRAREKEKEKEKEREREREREREGER